MDWISVILTVAGSLLIARHDIRGFILWIAANITWIAWALSQSLWSIVALNAMYFAINVYGIRRWRRNATHQRP